MFNTVSYVRNAFHALIMRVFSPISDALGTLCLLYHLNYFYCAKLCSFFKFKNSSCPSFVPKCDY